MLLASIIILLIVLIMLRVPVSFVIFATGILGLLAIGGFGLVLPVMETAPSTAVRSTSLTAIPLFILVLNKICYPINNPELNSLQSTASC